MGDSFIYCIFPSPVFSCFNVFSIPVFSSFLYFSCILKLKFLYFLYFCFSCILPVFFLYFLRTFSCIPVFFSFLYFSCILKTHDLYLIQEQGQEIQEVRKCRILHHNNHTPAKHTRDKIQEIQEKYRRNTGEIQYRRNTGFLYYLQENGSWNMPSSLSSCIFTVFSCIFYMLHPSLIQKCNSCIFPVFFLYLKQISVFLLYFPVSLYFCRIFFLYFFFVAPPVSVFLVKIQDFLYFDPIFLYFDQKYRKNTG